MDNNLKYIMAYIGGEMTATEKLKFEQELDTNPKLVEALKLEKDIQNVFSDEGWFSDTVDDYAPEEIEKLIQFFKGQEARQLEETIRNIVVEKKRNIFFSNTSVLAIAATFTILIVLSVFLLLDQKPIDYEGLYAETITMQELPSLVSRNENDSLIVKGQTAFLEQNYIDAVRHFRQVKLQKNKLSSYETIYLGISYIELNRFDDALSVFKELEGSASIDSEQAKWYIALVYLKKEDVESLKTALNQIIEDKGANHEKALALMKKLD